MPGAWTRVKSICASRRTVALANCQSWADQGRAACSRWADQGSNQCRQWRDEGSSQCARWADEGSNHCCTWAPCSWFCSAFYWVARWVCTAYYWVANWVCQAYYWVANWVCQAYYWIANWVCQLWTLIFFVFCTNANGGAMFLLTDGGVLMNETASGYGTRRWWKLMPDRTGSYVNGLWTRMADSINSRKYFASAVLADGRLLVTGGEYSDASGSNSQDETALSEMYDPVANTWTSIAVPGGVTQIGDSPCCMLADGRLLLGSFNGTTTLVRAPATGNWTVAGVGGGKGDSGSEETWVLMANGTVVAPQCSTPPSAEMYNPATDRWQANGTLAANIVENASSEVGPGILLPDGRAFFVGSTRNTALYQPGATAAAAGTWTAGPQVPQTQNGQNQGSKDGPGALLPSGTFLFPVAPVDGTRNNYLQPCTFFEFDGTNLTAAPNPPNPNCPTYVGRLMLVPTGQVLWAREDDDAIYAYTETGTFQNAWRPVITGTPATVVPGSTIVLSGTQFNGLSHAVAYGDDYTAATNYPLVRIRNVASGTVRYCRTANHVVNLGAGSIPSMGVATGAAIVSTSVSIPGDLQFGASELQVVANGIPSDPVRITVRREGSQRQDLKQDRSEMTDTPREPLLVKGATRSGVH